VSNFDQLHPALQHHIVNSLGWRELRPFQDQIIPSLLAGDHLLVLAPTAGGKTESAFFPVLSRMLTERWSGLSILYVCPIKALLNNLDARIERYCELLGRRSTLWHGDIKPSARRRILREPPDCLLTTPESLEVMLVSASIDSKSLFSNLRVVIVDEIHAFAGDDRGWHLLSVLERIARIAGREIQRIGLSATVGNPETLLEWLAGSCHGRRRVFRPDDGTTSHADVMLDYVGSLENAAVVISRLHRGEKRLVFVDSRAKAEQLSAKLLLFDVTTFVTHSSLSQEQRQQAEDAFAARENCVIVATSVLELGIDVGSLDRVIQIDAPPTVSSFLQRMGRTGRRPGSTRNCLLLATSDDSLVRAAGLIDLWSAGYIEDVVPPPLPYHILAQQLMALTLQEKGIGRAEIWEWIGSVAAFRAMRPDRREQVVQWMLDQEILWCGDGIIGFGQKGEEAYGRKNFLELFSVFLSPPLFCIRHGRNELGFVDESTFFGKNDGPRNLLLGGRAWLVNHIDWKRRIAYVEATNAKGQSRWKGWTRGLDYPLCQSIKRVLSSRDGSERWSRRATDQIEEIRDEFAWLEPGSSVILMDRKEVEWWTFGGTRANATLARALAEATHSRVEHDAFSLTFESGLSLDEIQSAVKEIRLKDIASLRPSIDEEAIKGLKFSACLPDHLSIEMLEQRLADTDSTKKTLEENARYVSGASGRT
jgi:ATP-dependent helicase Lhr and Lhr-like helicase